MGKQISQHLKPRIWPKQSGSKLSTTHILTLVGNLNVKPCSNQRVLRSWKQSKRFSWLKACARLVVQRPAGDYTHSSSALGLQIVLQTHHLIPHWTHYPNSHRHHPNPLPLKKCSLSSEDTKLSLSIQATNKFQSCFPGVITGSFWLNLQSFPWNSPNYIYKMSLGLYLFHR